MKPRVSIELPDPQSMGFKGDFRSWERSVRGVQALHRFTLEESMDATARALEILANQEKLAREHVREAREALSPSWGETRKCYIVRLAEQIKRSSGCGDKRVILSAIELLPVPSMERLERINDAVDTMISPESLRDGTFIIEPT